MKLFKMLVCAVALSVVSAANAHADLGVMSKDDVGNGQMLCPMVQAKLDAAQHRETTDAATFTGVGSVDPSSAAK